MADDRPDEKDRQLDRVRTDSEEPLTTETGRSEERRVGKEC